jgi:hypothetical protein
MDFLVKDQPIARICEGGAEWPSYSTTTRSLTA